MRAIVIDKYLLYINTKINYSTSSEESCQYKLDKQGNSLSLFV
jgi:hypothetical protein